MPSSTSNSDIANNLALALALLVYSMFKSLAYLEAVNFDCQNPGNDSLADRQSQQCMQAQDTMTDTSVFHFFGDLILITTLLLVLWHSDNFCRRENDTENESNIRPGSLSRYSLRGRQQHRQTTDQHPPTTNNELGNHHGYQRII